MLEHLENVLVYDIELSADAICEAVHAVVS